MVIVKLSPTSELSNTLEYYEPQADILCLSQYLQV